jgi:hypothetical protein
MSESSRKAWKRGAAGLCLLALVLLHAPILLAAWSIQTGMCCTGDYCPIAAHHHQKTHESPAYQMDCGHAMSGHQMNEMSGCAMSCCHDSNVPAIASVAFVMPFVLSLDGLVSADSPVVSIKQTDFLRATEPLFPPPRVPFSLS